MCDYVTCVTKLTGVIFTIYTRIKLVVHGQLKQHYMSIIKMKEGVYLRMGFGLWWGEGGSGSVFL